MNYSFVKISLKVIIMFAAISKAFGLSSAPQQHPLMPRQIDLSGNIVHFSMPENFSRDLPADDMIEVVDLNDKSVYQDYKKFTLIRRWWDFKDSGFFGKEYGTLMMSIYLKEASESLTVNTLKPLDFIDIIIDDIEKNKPEKVDPLLMYSDYFAAYKENWFQQQRWLKYVQDKTNPDQLLLLYAIPVTVKQFIVVEFTSAPNNDIGLRGFVDNYTEPFINEIMDSFHIDYVSDNPVKQAVLQSNTPPLQQMIDEKVKLLELTESKE
jgi:hypothetical protein